MKGDLQSESTSNDMRLIPFNTNQPPVSNVAILIGNSEYQSLSDLSCCQDDVCAMQVLLSDTEKYDIIHTIENTESARL
jgi:hypothetical protein